MDSKDLFKQLIEIAKSKNFVADAYEIIDTLESKNAGVESVQVIIKFMEENPSIDFGAPGPLVHYVEKFYGKGYEKNLLDSLRRKPTLSTILMLNRVINGTKEPNKKEELIEIMKQFRAKL